MLDAFALALASAALAMPSLALAPEKRPWDVARFSECVSRQGADQLDPMETISSVRCSRRDRADKEPATLTDLTVDTIAAVSRSKVDKSDWIPSLAFSIGYRRQATIFGGNAAAGFADYSRATLILDGKLVELPLQVSKHEVRGCGSMGRGALRVDTCGYDEVVWVPLTPELVDALRRADSPGGSVMKIKLFGQDGTDFTMDFSPAEVVAVNDAAKR